MLSGKLPPDRCSRSFASYIFYALFVLVIDMSIVTIIKDNVPKSSANNANAIYSHGLNKKAELLLVILREHEKAPNSDRVKAEVNKLAQAFKDARPSAGPKPGGKKVQDRARAAGQKLQTSNAKKNAEAEWQTIARKRKKPREKNLWERVICDAASIIQFSDGSSAPRLRTFEDGSSGYQVMSAGKLAEAMAYWYARDLGDTPFLVIAPPARPTNTPADQWELWRKRFGLEEIKLHFIDPDNAAAPPKEERCYAVQFGNEHICLELESSAAKATGTTAEFQLVSLQLPRHHFPNLTEEKLKHQFADIALKAVGPSDVYTNKVPKQIGVISTLFRGEQVTVVQCLVAVSNNKLNHAFRRSGMEGALIRSFRDKDPFQVALLPADKELSYAKQTAKECGLNSYGIVMTKRGYAIRVTPETRTSVEAKVNTEVAEALGDSFHLLQARNPDAQEFVVKGLHARMTPPQIIQTLMDALGWTVRPIHRLGKEWEGRCNWLVRSLQPPKIFFTKIQHGWVIHGIDIQDSKTSSLVRTKTSAFDSLPSS